MRNARCRDRGGNCRDPGKPPLRPILSGWIEATDRLRARGILLQGEPEPARAETLPAASSCRFLPGFMLMAAGAVLSSSTMNQRRRISSGRLWSACLEYRSPRDLVTSGQLPAARRCWHCHRPLHRRLHLKPFGPRRTRGTRPPAPSLPDRSTARPKLICSAAPYESLLRPSLYRRLACVLPPAKLEKSLQHLTYRGREKSMNAQPVIIASIEPDDA